jgi:hypothetical protein
MMDALTTIHRVLYQVSGIGLRTLEPSHRDWGIASSDWPNQIETGKI